METAFAELPLAVFTTLAPVGAGAFIALAVAFATGKFSDEQLKGIDKMTVVPFAVALVGFIASALHVANPAHAFGVFSGLGSSPLTNELCVGMIFMVVALVYTIMAVAGKLGGARKALSIVTAVLGAVFAVFVGLAYMLGTVQSWNTPLLPVQMLGFALVGGAALGGLVLALGKAAGEGSKAIAKTLGYVSVAGAVLALIGVCGFALTISGAGNAVVKGSALLGPVLPFLLIGIVLVVVSAVEMFLAARKGLSTGVTIRATVEAIVGVFLVRLSFYALFLSVGVTVL